MSGLFCHSPDNISLENRDIQAPNTMGSSEDDVTWKGFNPARVFNMKDPAIRTLSYCPSSAPQYKRPPTPTREQKAQMAIVNKFIDSDFFDRLRREKKAKVESGRQERTNRIIAFTNNIEPS